MGALGVLLGLTLALLIAMAITELVDLLTPEDD